MNDNLITDFDRQILGNKLTIIKLLIPYIDSERQMLFALIIRIIEFKMTLDFYRDNSMFLKNTKKAFSVDDILSDILEQSSPETKKMYSTFKTFMKMSETMDTLNTSDSSVDMLKGMLTKEQQDMYEKYSQLLNN